MPKQIYLTPGPSELYPTVWEHTRKAFQEGVPSISHRSSAFKSLYQHTEESLRELLQLPSEWRVLFTASATEVWERLLQSTVRQRSLHLVNGSFSQRFWHISQQLGYQAMKVEADAGSAVRPHQVAHHEDVELLAVTHNETSTGVSQPLEDLQALRSAYPNALIALDAVSSMPHPQVPWQYIDSAYFSVQKGFGLPAGLGVWLIHEKWLDKSKAMLDEGRTVGSYHSLPELAQRAEQHQTPETPNVLSIYLLGHVASDMLTAGMKMIRRDMDYKAALLYQKYEQSEVLSPFVADPQLRSKTVAIAHVSGGSSQLIKDLQAKGISVGAGYGPFKDEQIRIANFPAHSREVMENLVDNLLP